MTGPEQSFVSHSAEATEAIAAKLAEGARPGMVVCLTGDLGAGKTAFAKGFARGLGVTEMVTSPTFTLLHEYRSGRLPLYHFDVYRLCGARDFEDNGFDEYLYANGVCLIEWAQLIRECLPGNALWVDIRRGASCFIEESTRSIVIRGAADENIGD